jgi:FkbM family methyltransferase
MNRAISPTKPTYSEVHGHIMNVRPTTDAVSNCLLRNQVWEPLETFLITREIKQGDAVVDLGANIGYYTLLLAKLVGPQGRVHAFEPDPDNFAILEKNVASNGYRNVKLVRQAVSGTTGDIKLYRAEDDPGDHRVYDSHDDRQSIIIRATRLDDYFDGREARIDFIKMDIQGAEGAALEGMFSLLERNQGVRLLMEFWPIGLQRNGLPPEQCLDFLLKRGFLMYELRHREGIGSVDIPELLSRYSVDSKSFTNLFFTRQERVWKSFNEMWMAEADGGWWNKLADAKRELGAAIPRGTSFILADESLWGDDGAFADRRTIPFTERDGQYWGPPGDDDIAISELERLKRARADFLVIAWPAFWWLDYYSKLNKYVRSRFRCVLENERLIVFDLRSAARG